jgi:hypothetical protein
MSSKRKHEYYEDCLPIIDIGSAKKKIIKNSAYLLQTTIAEFERGFHNAYLQKHLDDLGIKVIDGEVTLK